MPDIPGVSSEVRTLLDLGLAGWFILTIIALMRRWVITRQTYEERVAGFKEELAKADRLYERERADRIEAQKEVAETIEVLKLAIRVADQLNEVRK